MGEESPDFTGEDTSERLGAVRLRRVPQKIVRYLINLNRQVENAPFGRGPYS